LSRHSRRPNSPTERYTAPAKGTKTKILLDHTKIYPFAGGDSGISIKEGHKTLNIARGEKRPRLRKCARKIPVQTAAAGRCRDGVRKRQCK